MHCTVEKSHDIFRKGPFVDVPHIKVLAVGIARFDHVEIGNCTVA